MVFWRRWRGTGRHNSEGSSALAIGADLEPIGIYFIDGAAVHGWTAPTDERLTDLLNRQAVLRIHQPSPADEPPRPGTWRTVTCSEILFVTPPPHRFTSRRVHRVRRRVRANIGPYQITGSAHLAPGTSLLPFLMRTGQQFLPLTDVTLHHGTDPSRDRHEPVVLLNLAAATEVAELLRAT